MTDHLADSESDTVTIIVDAFIEKFGDRAIAVAQRQLKTAGPDSVEKWREIVGRLKGVSH